MPALWLSNVRKSYGGRALWTSVDLTVETGETVALLGANGAGKSTLLRIAATVCRPTAGSVVVGNVDARREPEKARCLLGYQPQDAPVYAELTPAEHLRWWMRLHDAPVDVDAALVHFGLAAMAHKPSATLSRGQRQRVALAMASLHAPPLLLLDEPFTALDGAGQSVVGSILESRRGNQGTLLALHDEAQARRLADRVVRLDRNGVHA